MTTPRLSAPVLFLPQDLRSNTQLTSQITRLTNDAFRRSKLPDPDKWNYERPRFPTHESYYEMLGDETIVAVIFDQDVCTKDDSASSALESDAITNCKVVACAASVPWKGGWAKEGAGEEDGWEIKALAVDGDAAYLRKGLAVRVMAALENHLIERTKSQVKANLPQGTIPKRYGCVTLWILAADCINGAYWRKKGYREVRRSTEGEGIWGCKTSFDIVVFRKDLTYDVSH
jgi:ribosomal protein S18 acetylase RimI-like enzyme